MLITVVSSSCSSNSDDKDRDVELVPAGGMVDFENLLENAFLDNQDNWRDQVGSGQAVVSLDGTSTNGTQVITPLLETALNAPVNLSRQNDVAFAFPSFTSSDDGHYVQFDLTGVGIALMALGSDADDDGVVSPAAGETGPQFGIANGNFQLHRVGEEQVLQSVLNPGDALTDWYQLRLQLTVDSTSGLYKGSLLYRNLTDQDAEFRPVNDLQNIDLGLGSNDLLVLPDAWDTIFVHLQSDGGRTPDIDNLLPHGIPAD